MSSTKVLTVREAFDDFLPLLKQFQRNEISEKTLKIIFMLHNTQYTIAKYAIKRYLNGDDPYTKKTIKCNVEEKVKDVKEKKIPKRYYNPILLTITHIDGLEYKISKRLYPVYEHLLDMYNNGGITYKDVKKCDKIKYISLRNRYFSPKES